MPAERVEIVVLTLAYRSDATQRLPLPALNDICLTSAYRNQALGITGFLVEYEGTFIQILEGEPGPVTNLYASILRDPRHHAIKTLLMQRREGPPAHGFWAMNFSPLADPGFWRDVLDGPLSAEEFRARSHEPAFSLEIVGRAYRHGCDHANLSAAMRHLIRAAIPQSLPAAAG